MSKHINKKRDTLLDITLMPSLWILSIIVFLSCSKCAFINGFVVVHNNININTSSCFTIKKKAPASKIRETTIIARKALLDNGGNKEDQGNEAATTSNDNDNKPDTKLFSFLSSTLDVIGTTTTV